MLKIAPAYEDEDVAGLIIQPNYRALKILRRGLVGHCAVCFCFAKGGRVFGISLMIVIGMLFNLVEICAERILGNFLKVDIDCCVNPKTFVHRAIPSHRGNYFLTDVIIEFERSKICRGVLTACKQTHDERQQNEDLSAVQAKHGAEL